MSLKDRSMAFIGGGHITEIIISNLTKTDNVVSRRLIVSDPVKKNSKTFKASIMEAVHAAIRKADNFP